MIRHIVALDDKRGIAKDGAMPPWHLKQDEAFFTAQTKLHGGHLLMGKKTFTEALHGKPLTGRTNYVLSRDTTPLDGAELIHDLDAFMRDWPADKNLWVIGGAELFEQTLAQADELLITEIEGDFGCDRFYPDYSHFQRVSQSPPQVEHGVTYYYCRYAANRP